mmetsp:Transcript_23138/g.54707  ORF Transcript_23138/g.54707 Transcript_23138/m.54707 type:complete len:236 (-) Transcript_23138:607-1314(-)
MMQRSRLIANNTKKKILRKPRRLKNNGSRTLRTKQILAPIRSSITWHHSKKRSWKEDDVDTRRYATKQTRKPKSRPKRTNSSGPASENKMKKRDVSKNRNALRERMKNARPRKNVGRRKKLGERRMPRKLLHERPNPIEWLMKETARVVNKKAEVHGSEAEVVESMYLHHNVVEVAVVGLMIGEVVVVAIPVVDVTKADLVATVTVAVTEATVIEIEEEMIVGDVRLIHISKAQH